MSKIQVDDIVNNSDNGAPSFPYGAVVTGVITATTFVGQLTGTAGTITTLNSTSGTITNLTGTAGTITTLSSTNGTIITLTGTTITGTSVRGGIGVGTSVASTSGTSIDFTSIPSYVKRITVMFGAVSTNGTSNIQAQIGSGSIDTASTYAGVGSWVGGTNNAGGVQDTTGFIIVGNVVAASTYGGSLVFTTIGSNIWCLNGTLSSTSSTAYNHVSSGNKTLSGTLDRVRITTVNGTDTFDAGSINILYEG